MADKMIWGALLHFGANMWSDVPVERDRSIMPKWAQKFGAWQSDEMRLDYPLWKETTERMAAAKMNLIVVDVGEALVYPSHPELAVKGSWSAEKLAEEVKRLRALGLEPIPKLNFSTAHDTWLKDYGRMVSTREYYQVCSDVMRDVCEVFCKPRLFHLGYDEETFPNQVPYDLAIVRQGELWWHDFNFFVSNCERLGARPWIWSDYVWNHRDEFLRRMPKSVLQSNWYYGKEFDLAKPKSEHVRTQLQTYLTLDKAGFDQVPCCSNHREPASVPNTVAFARKNFAPGLLKGFLAAPWCRTQEKWRERLMQMTELMGAEIAKWQTT